MSLVGRYRQCQMALFVYFAKYNKLTVNALVTEWLVTSTLRVSAGRTGGDGNSLTRTNILATKKTLMAILDCHPISLEAQST